MVSNERLTAIELTIKGYNKRQILKRVRRTNQLKMKASTFYETFQLEKYGNILKPVESLHSIEDQEAKSEVEDWMMRESELGSIQISDDK